MSSGKDEESNDAEPSEEKLQNDVEMEDISIFEETGAVGGIAIQQIGEKNGDEKENQNTHVSSKETKLDGDACDIYYSKHCINAACPKKHKQFIIAYPFVKSFFKMFRKTTKPQFICLDCYGETVSVYEESAAALLSEQPLKLDIINEHYDYVDVLSSDEETENKEPENKETENNDTENKEPENKDTENKENDPTYEGIPDFPEENLDVDQTEMLNCMENVFDKMDIKRKLIWANKMLTDAVNKFDEDFAEAIMEQEDMFAIVDNMHYSFETFAKCKRIELPAVDLDDDPLVTDIQNILPAALPIERPAILLNTNYYAVKNNLIASWVPCRVVEFVDGLTGIDGVRYYKIQYQLSKNHIIRTVPAKHLAYFDATEIKLPIGTRVITLYNATTMAVGGSEKVPTKNAFYPGIIAEPFKKANKFRYLIFYDDGYTEYVQPQDVRLVCQSSDKVWEDVYPAAREFIQTYVEQCSVNKPMVQTEKGQVMRTESNGIWQYAKVIDIDNSLILMQFDSPANHTEWLYRGSMRLKPIFEEYQKQLKAKKATYTPARMPRRTEPFIRYTKDLEGSKNLSADGSTSQPMQNVNSSTMDVDRMIAQPYGETIHFTPKNQLLPKPWKQHECNPSCLYIISNQLKSYNPLVKPLLSGWERKKFIKQTARTESSQIVYTAPCGKSLRKMEEVRRYLRITDNVLNVDNFDFNLEIRCLVEYKILYAKQAVADISNGQEQIAVTLVNIYDKTLPQSFIYAAQRIPTDGVFLNLDEEFLCGCDCEDDCSNKFKCSCWQLTVQGVRFCNPTMSLEKIGYQYKRLYEPIPTGIYECNSRCKCKSNCLNRVAQHSLQIKLKVFKTSNRGWGVLCSNDIPRGTFICIYTGQLLTEAKANEGFAADDYFADLDYIEVAEQLKEGYEIDVHSEPKEKEGNITDRSDPEHNKFQPTQSFMNSAIEGAASLNVEQDSQERQVINFIPNAEINNENDNSVRQMFGKDEAPYVMDALHKGNLGRYLNHSCNPNLFVQNVFVDTHDLRFPWVAFFAVHNIAAGTELTWNYNYEPGAVPGRELYCHCGSDNCRIRLL